MRECYISGRKSTQTKHRPTKKQNLCLSTKSAKDDRLLVTASAAPVRILVILAPISLGISGSSAIVKFWANAVATSNVKKIIRILVCGRKVTLPFVAPSVRSTANKMPKTIDRDLQTVDALHFGATNNYDGGALSSDADDGDDGRFIGA